MILYIMRHGEAVDASRELADEWRYLTDTGRSQADRTISGIIKLGPKPRLTLTSPLTRAVQTAEIAARKACRRNRVQASTLLLPGGDIRKLVEHINECRDHKRLLLVGHEPQLGALTATLLGRTSGDIALKKGACVALELKPEKADFLWYLIPGRKAVTSLKKAFGTT